jgi:hypothetical protein
MRKIFSLIRFWFELRVALVVLNLKEIKNNIKIKIVSYLGGEMRERVFEREIANCWGGEYEGEIRETRPKIKNRVNKVKFEDVVEEKNKVTLLDLDELEWQKKWEESGFGVRGDDNLYPESIEVTYPDFNNCVPLDDKGFDVCELEQIMNSVKKVG